MKANYKKVKLGSQSSVLVNLNDLYRTIPTPKDRRGRRIRRRYFQREAKRSDLDRWIIQQLHDEYLEELKMQILYGDGS